MDGVTPIGHPGHHVHHRQQDHHHHHRPGPGHGAGGLGQGRVAHVDIALHRQGWGGGWLGLVTALLASLGVTQLKALFKLYIFFKWFL